MTYRPIHIEGSLSALFGPAYETQLDAELVKTLKDTLKDGTLSNADFSKYEKNKGATNFLRRLYYHLRRFSEADAFHDRLSKMEVGDFYKWFSSKKSSADFDPQTYHSLGVFVLTYPDASVDQIMDGANFYQHKNHSNPLTITEPRLLIVTHPSADFDENRRAKDGINSAIESAEQAKIPTIYLSWSSLSFDKVYPDDMTPTYYYRSFNGKHRINFTGDEATVSGGHFLACLRLTLVDLIAHRSTAKPLTIRIPMDAVYSSSFSLEGAPISTLRSHLNGETKPNEYLLKHLQTQVANKVERGNTVTSIRNNQFLITFDDDKRAPITVIFE